MEKNSIRIMYSGDRQIAAMRHFFPKCAYKKNGEQIVFYVRLKVHEKIPEYKVKLIYQGNIPPKVYVVYPEIMKMQNIHIAIKACVCIIIPTLSGLRLS